MKDSDMNGSWFFDENFNGVPDDFFDSAIKYFDFPLEDVEPHNGAGDWEAQFKFLEPPPSHVLAGISSGVCLGHSKATTESEKSSSVSSTESSELKRRPHTGEASCSRGNSSEGTNPKVFRTSSPISVLESSGSSFSAENPAPSCPKFVVPVKRPRSKRPRPQRRTFPFVVIPYGKKFYTMAASELESESDLDEKSLNLAKRRQKKKAVMPLSCDVEGKKPSLQQPVETRRCSHCQVTKTPQWREGPLGPKTLCNACGVRYRSGRLLPEYRPAASPTFVPSIHSNSHRKVLEMRKKAGPVENTTPTAALMPTAF